jgi:ribonuclease HIII
MIKNSALKQIQDLQKNIRHSNFVCTEIEEKQYNFEFTAIKNGKKNKIQVYFGKKGIRNVIQGNSDSEEYIEISSLLSGNLTLPFSKEANTKYEEYIGTDETGKGDYFGPLVIAGFYINLENASTIYDFGVKDSKELNDNQINFIAKKIINQFPNNCEIISIFPEKYNELYERINNVNKLLNWGHSKVVENLLRKHLTKIVITDQFSKEPLQISKSVEFSDVDFIQMTKAERHLGVAAASILARFEMNKWFEQKQNEGFNVKKGASGEVELAAKSILKRNGHKILNSLVKLHFKTTQKIFED